jgi:hypothetical protein
MAMKYDFKRTFDAVRLPPGRCGEIRSALSAGSAETRAGAGAANTRPRKKNGFAIAAAAAALIIAASAGSFALGGQIIRLLGGGSISSGTDSFGNDYATITLNSESVAAETRDGRVYFVLDGSGDDITSYCSEETYFLYERVDDGGHRHAVLVGGDPDSLGWAEFVWSENGAFMGCTAITNGGDSEPAWLELGRKNLGIAGDSGNTGG